MTSVHAPVLRRHGGGFGQRQVGSRRDRGDAVAPDRPRTWPERKNSGTAKAPKPLLDGSVKERGLGQAPAHGSERRSLRAKGRAQQGRSESRMPARAPVTKLRGCRSKGRKSEARHRAPSMRQRKARGKARRNSRRGWSIHTPVRVGSAGMPAPFALRAPHFLGPAPDLRPRRTGRNPPRLSARTPPSPTFRRISRAVRASAAPP